MCPLARLLSRRRECVDMVMGLKMLAFRFVWFCFRLFESVQRVYWKYNLLQRRLHLNWSYCGPNLVFKKVFLFCWEPFARSFVRSIVWADDCLVMAMVCSARPTTRVARAACATSKCMEWLAIAIAMLCIQWA